MAEEEQHIRTPVEKVSFDLRTKDVADLQAEVVKGRIVEAALKEIDQRARGFDFSLSFSLHFGKQQLTK
jgi:hypothetical protein